MSISDQMDKENVAYIAIYIYIYICVCVYIYTHTYIHVGKYKSSLKKQKEILLFATI